MKRITLVLGAIFCWLSSAGQLFSQDGAFGLDAIVVTASRVESRVREAPSNITIVSKDVIEEEGTRTVADALRTEAGVYSTNILNNPKTSTIDIRGYGETAPQNVLVLIDGRRVNNVDISGADFSQIPMEMVERIEVYRGSGSVLFGDNATAGVINIIMKKGEGKPLVTTRVNAGSYGFYNPSLSLSGKEQKLSYYVVSSSVDSEGYRHNNNFSGKDVFGNFSFDLSQRLTVLAKAGYHKDRYGLAGALTSFDLDTGRLDRKDSDSPFDNARTEDSFLDLGADVKFDRDTTLYLGGSYRNRNSSSHWDFFKWDTKRNMQTWGFTPKLVSTKENSWIKNSVVAGFDYYRYTTESDDVSAGVPSTTEIDKTDYGFYINDEVTLMKNLLLSAGYRVNKAKYDFDFVDRSGAMAPMKDSLNVEKEAFRSSINYLFSEKGNVFVSYAKGFRLPATDEFFSALSVPPVNRNLEAQTSYQVDIGLRWNPLKTLGGSITLFQSKTDNEIFFNPITFTNSNYERTKREGIETSIFIVPADRIRFSLNYSYIKATFDGGVFNGNDIPFVPRNKLSSKLTYIYDKFTFNLIGTYTGDRYMISDQENRFGKLPGVTTFDFNADYRYKGLAVFLSLKNITGQRYNDYGSIFAGTTYLYPAPERQVVLGIQYSFGG